MSDEKLTPERAECTCPRIKIGMEVTELRNLSPHCPIHGAEHDRQADILFGSSDD